MLTLDAKQTASLLAPHLLAVLAEHEDALIGELNYLARPAMRTALEHAEAQLPAMLESLLRRLGDPAVMSQILAQIRVV
jgi:hypothetical protein